MDKFKEDDKKRQRQYVLVCHWIHPLIEKGLWKCLTKDYRTKLIKEVFEFNDDVALDLKPGILEELNELVKR